MMARPISIEMQADVLESITIGDTEDYGLEIDNKKTYVILTISTLDIAAIEDDIKRGLAVSVGLQHLLMQYYDGNYRY